MQTQPFLKALFIKRLEEVIHPAAVAAKEPELFLSSKNTERLHKTNLNNGDLSLSDTSEDDETPPVQYEHYLAASKLQILKNNIAARKQHSFLELKRIIGHS